MIPHQFQKDISPNLESAGEENGGAISPLMHIRLICFLVIILQPTVQGFPFAERIHHTLRGKVEIAVPSCEAYTGS